MTSAEVLLCILVDLERTEKVNKELITEELNKEIGVRDDYRLGFSRGRMNLCNDLIGFIKNNLEVRENKRLNSELLAIKLKTTQK